MNIIEDERILKINDLEKAQENLKESMKNLATLIEKPLVYEYPLMKNLAKTLITLHQFHEVIADKFEEPCINLKDVLDYLIRLELKNK